MFKTVQIYSCHEYLKIQTYNRQKVRAESVLCVGMNKLFVYHTLVRHLTEILCLQQHNTITVCHPSSNLIIYKGFTVISTYPPESTSGWGGEVIETACAESR